MKNKFKNYPALLQEKYQKLTNIVQLYQNSYPVIKMSMNNITTLYNEKLHDIKPQIMVYGIYNAGKSSIINELLKEDRAVVNDIPTTDKITYYEWNGYKIADTPGVGAPIEHEQITNEHLKKADVVLFVMSTTGSNEKAQNYSRMKDIADTGKKIIIILNDKNGYLGKRDDIINEIKMKVRNNMKTVHIDNVDSKYCIVVVNAVRARKGRISNKPALLAKSGLAELENVILTELKNTTSFDIIRNAIYEIEQNLKEIISILNASMNNSNMEAFNRVLDTLKEQKIIIRTDVNEYIQEQAKRLSVLLPELIWQNKDSQDKITNVIQEQVTQLNIRVQKRIEEDLKNMQDVLSVDLENLVNFLEKVDLTNKVKTERNISVNINDVGNLKGVSSEYNVGDMLKTAKALLDAVNMGKKILLSDKKGVLSAILPELPTDYISKKIATTVISKIAGKAVSQAAAQVIPVIGQIITIGQILFTLLGGSDEEYRRKQAEAEARNEYERKKAEAEAQARQDLQQKCIYMADDIANEMSYVVNDIIRDVVGGIENKIKDTMKINNNDLKKKIMDIEKLNSLYNEYNIIQNELG